MAQPGDRDRINLTDDDEDEITKPPSAKQQLALWNLLLYTSTKLAEQYGGREEEGYFQEMIDAALDSGITPTHPKVPKVSKKK